jgi:serine/threonine protein kinase
MHGKRILHRDIKTANIFIMEDGALKLGDFGIARDLVDLNAKILTEVGTPQYMAPEILEGLSYDARADMWSLGIILYELVTL